jgi:hypothetical protein
MLSGIIDRLNGSVSALCDNNDVLTVPTSTAIYSFLNSWEPAVISWVGSAGASANPNAIVNVLRTKSSAFCNVGLQGFILAMEDRNTVPRNNSIYNAIVCDGTGGNQVIAGLGPPPGNIWTPQQQTLIMLQYNGSSPGNSPPQKMNLFINNTTALQGTGTGGSNKIPRRVNSETNLTLGGNGDNLQELVIWKSWLLPNFPNMRTEINSYYSIY